MLHKFSYGRQPTKEYYMGVSKLYQHTHTHIHTHKHTHTNTHTQTNFVKKLCWPIYSTVAIMHSLLINKAYLTSVSYTEGS